MSHSPAAPSGPPAPPGSPLPSGPGLQPGKSQAGDVFRDAQSALIRAIAQRRELDVSYVPAALIHQKISQMPLAQARLSAHSGKAGEGISPNEKSLMRAEADFEGLRLKYHDSALHQRGKNYDDRVAAMLDSLERARLEILGARRYKGMSDNFDQSFAARAAQLGYHHLNTPRLDTMSDAVYLWMKMQANGKDAQDLPPQVQHFYHVWQDWLNEHLSKVDFDQVSTIINSQAHFAKFSKKLLHRWNLIDAFDEDEDGENDHHSNSKNGKKQHSPNADSDSQGLESAEDSHDHHADQDTRADEGEGGQNADTEGDGQAWDDGESGEHGDSGLNQKTGMDQEPDGQGAGANDDSAGAQPYGDIRSNRDAANHVGTIYPIYCTQYDEVIDAAELADFEELYRLRAMLDKHLAHLQPLIAKLANRLQRKLLAQQQRSWLFDREEGYLDSARLARVIANPSMPLTFKQEKEIPFKDTVVTLLLDNSGSMRGRPIMIAAMCADILARTLERCAVKVEILGFTTKMWKGGRSRELWLENGRPPHPGRLNDLRHIIYKSADQPMRRARKNLGLMLKEGILKENIDGEALVWAYNRLAVRAEERKILMVISDGAPVDDSTLAANPANMLEHDLRHVIARIEMINKVHLTAIGIGHDVTRYYQNSMMIHDPSELGEALIANLSGLFDN